MDLKHPPSGFQTDPLLAAYADSSSAIPESDPASPQSQQPQIDSQLDLPNNPNNASPQFSIHAQQRPRCDHCRRAGLHCTFNDAEAEARQRAISATSMIALGPTNNNANNNNINTAAHGGAPSNNGASNSASTASGAADATQGSLTPFAPPEKLIYPYTAPPQPTIDELNDWCGVRGYAIVTQRSKKDRDGKVSKVYLRCDRGGRYECEIDEHLRQRGNYTIRRQECPWSAYLLKQGEVWLFVLRDEKHNHEPSTNPDSHPALKKLAWDRQRGMKRPAGEGVVGSSRTDLERDLTEKQREILEKAKEPRAKRPNGGRKVGENGQSVEEQMPEGGGLQTVFRV